MIYDMNRLCPFAASNLSYFMPNPSKAAYCIAEAIDHDNKEAAIITTLFIKEWLSG